MEERERERERKRETERERRERERERESVRYEIFYDTEKLVYFTNKSFPENDRTNKILNLEVS